MASSSTTRHWRFHVFLSFRGKDTRKTIISYLRSELQREGLNVFKDDGNLRLGDPISDGLVEAIQESRFAVVVISQNYASSRWCLDELRMIMECKDKGMLTIVPIFYEVDPSDVRHQKGIFAEAFEKHNGRVTAEKVQKWREALSKVANLCGVDSRKWPDDDAVVRKVVGDITRRLFSGDFSRRIGMNAHLRAHHSLSKMGPGKEVRMIGIWGMGGTGKTTIGKYVGSFFTNLSTKKSWTVDLPQSFEDGKPVGFIAEVVVSFETHHSISDFRVCCCWYGDTDQIGEIYSCPDDLPAHESDSSTNEYRHLFFACDFGEEISSGRISFDFKLDCKVHHASNCCHEACCSIWLCYSSEHGVRARTMKDEKRRDALRGEDSAIGVASLPRKKNEVELCSVGDIDFSKTQATIGVRMVNVWKAQNFKHNDHVTGTELIVLDDKDKSISVFIPNDILPKFNELIKEGNQYLITNFTVKKNKETFRITDHRFMIQFNENTELRRIDDGRLNIKRYIFRFRNYGQLLELMHNQKEWPDVIGQFISINDIWDVGFRRSLIDLKLSSGDIIEVILWEDLAIEASSKIKVIIGKPIVVLVTNLRPKIFRGNLSLNSSVATKVFVNEELPEIVEFRKRYVDENVVAESVKKHLMEGETSGDSRCSFKDIARFISKQHEEVKKTFVCEATIIDILGRNGWSYISCGKCSKKLSKTETSLFCDRCNADRPTGILRYSIEAKVYDGNDTSTFVIFDRVARQLVSIDASEMANNVKDTSSGEEHNVPDQLKILVGKSFVFKIQLTPFNYKFGMNRCTVLRIWNMNTAITEQRTNTMST